MRMTMSRTGWLLAALLLTLGLAGCGGDGAEEDSAAEPAADAEVAAAPADPTEEAAAAPTPEGICGTIDPESFRSIVVGTRSDLDEEEFQLTMDGDACVFTLGTEETPELGPITVRIDPADDFDSAVADGEGAASLSGVGDQATYLESATDAPFGAVVVQVGEQVVVVSGIGHPESLQEFAGTVAGQL